MRPIAARRTAYAGMNTCNHIMVADRTYRKTVRDEIEECRRARDQSAIERQPVSNGKHGVLTNTVPEQRQSEPREAGASTQPHLKYRPSGVFG